MSRPLFRRARPPAGLSLEPGERVLADAATIDGAAVATNHRLLLPAVPGFHAIGWASVERASWDRDDDQLVVVESTPIGSPPRRHRISLEDATRFLDIVREQVQASVVISRQVPLVGERGVRVSGRRRPGQQGLMWVVALDTGIELDDPAMRGRIEAAVAQIRAEVE